MMTSFAPEEVVRALYLAVFGREADDEGLAVHAAMITNQADRLSDLSRRFYDSEEHKRHLHANPVLVDHSQDGEYPIILRRLVKAGQRHGIIVDVGARGRDRSNSFDLLKDFGWRGLLIEANPSLEATIRREFEGLDYRLESCAVGVETGTLPFYLGVNDDVSSLIEDMAAAWGEVQGRIDVEVRRLGPLMEAHEIPYDFDILTLDIEGMDIPVLNDIIENTSYRPLMVLAEASFDYQTKSLDDIDVIDAVKDCYALVDQTGPNLVLGLRSS